jgi:hypothetical protein
MSVPIFIPYSIPFWNGKSNQDKMIKLLEVLANYVATRKRGKNGKTYESPRIYLPTKLTCDSCFPMSGRLVRVRVRVRVEGKRLLVERASKKDLERFGELPAKRAKRKKHRKSR